MLLVSCESELSNTTAVPSGQEGILSADLLQPSASCCAPYSSCRMVRLHRQMVPSALQTPRLPRYLNNSARYWGFFRCLLLARLHYCPASSQLAIWVSARWVSLSLLQCRIVASRLFLGIFLETGRDWELPRFLWDA